MNRSSVTRRLVIFASLLMAASSLPSTANAQIGRGGIIRRMRERAATRYEQAAEEAKRIAEEQARQQRAAEKGNSAQSRRANERVETDRRRQQIRRLQEQQRQQIERARAAQSRSTTKTPNSNRENRSRSADIPNRPADRSPQIGATGRAGGYRPLFPQGYRPPSDPNNGRSSSDSRQGSASQTARDRSNVPLPTQRVRNSRTNQNEFFGMALSYSRARGVVVDSLTPNSIAAKSGIKVGDEVRELAGMKINNSELIRGLESAFRPGDQIGVVVIRDGQKEDVTIQVPAGRGGATAQLGLQPKTPSAAKRIDAPQSGIILGGSPAVVDNGESEIVLGGESDLDAADRLRADMFRDFPEDNRTEADYNRLLFGSETDTAEPESIPAPKSRSASTSDRESARKPELPEIPTVDEVNRKLDRLMELIESQQKIIEKQSKELKDLKKESKPNRREF